MRNVKLVVAYDGTRYLGWQKTKEGASIEQELIAAIERILQHPIQLNAAGRTDAGVHAIGQTVNFLTDRTDLEQEKLFRGINALLPSDIALYSLECVDLKFHATVDCIGKEYTYRISYGQIYNPLNRFFVWYYPYLLNIEEMHRAGHLLIGEHDFSAFCNVKKNETYDNYVRRIDSITMTSHVFNEITISIRGHHFLYKMVRNLVGLLVYIGQGKLGQKDVVKILESRSRVDGAMTAPALGLCLKECFYAL